ncbi:MAG TPA: serine/threonine-protein kinase [Pyrinomonadaceae bacterium]|jgi:serine/threonine protein kinase
MGDLEQYVGQILDDKYRLERLLGQGGMGAVYLATHLGTDRYVALKLIAPQFMRNEEFVERFKREARAAGRLRHPNVVDVTDFGFSGDDHDRVAYLVMEYLDGCTLSDVLAEENRLPLDWVVDILEQVCAAVHEAHQQGIVHRDLKPDNIWLEPNGLGGYRVKVLDFGIAKLAETSATPAPIVAGAETIDSAAAAQPALEAATLIYPATEGDGQETQNSTDAEQQTRLLDARQTAGLAIATAVPVHTAAAGLTRVGSILGTPLYMSPEQCRGERLDARSDIYSIGVIAYQMLTGAPPFTGDTANVIRAHNENQPTPVREMNKKLPKRVSRMVMSALEKDRDRRPQTAIAFALAMRANADGLGALYRRAFALYSEYFPKFLKLSLLAHIPVIIVTLASVAFRIAQPGISKGGQIAIGIPLALLQVIAAFVTGSIISAVTAIIVTQLAVAPMKPVQLRAAFDVLRRRWKPFLKTAWSGLWRIALGYVLFIIPGIVLQVRYLLWGPVVLMEGLEKKAALKRAVALARRSWRTIILAMLIQFLVPALIGSIFGALIGTKSSKSTGWHIKVTAQLSSLVNIFVLPLLAIVPALLYLKMRQFGGETLSDVMAQLEDLEGTKSGWRQRMRSRLTVTPQSRTPTY